MAAIRFLLESEDLRGLFNLTGPQPVTNDEFTAALADHLTALQGLLFQSSASTVLGDMAAALSSQYVATMPAGCGFEPALHHNRPNRERKRVR